MGERNGEGWDVAADAEAALSDCYASKQKLEADLAESRSRSERFARAAMHAAELIDLIPYFNGARQVAAYQQFDQTWMTTLTAEDMRFARGVVGLPEPDDNAPEGT